MKEKEEGPAGAGFLEMNLSPLFNSVILKLYCASESTGGFVKTQIVGLPLRFSDSVGLRRKHTFAFLTSSQGMLLIQRPHIEKH